MTGTPKRAKRGGSVKPGVERSGTPDRWGTKEGAREVGESEYVQELALSHASRAWSFLSIIILGFRSASPQALCFHPLRGF
jgi:hypothetical protein